MKILVTGGQGGVGRPLVERLLKHGHEVRVLDRQSEPGIAGATCVVGDLTHFATVRAQAEGMNAIIHLAALTHPAAGASSDIFHINCTGTFNVYEAAAQASIRRVVCASSINALGFNFGVKHFPIGSLPIDETHPSYTTDVYSFSKQTVEEIAAYYWRREGISGTQLRLPFVYTHRLGYGPMLKKMMAISRKAYQQLMQMPEAEQIARVKLVLAQKEKERSERLSEKPWDQRGERPKSFEEIDPMTLLIMGYTDFWAIIGGEDAAQAFEKSVTAQYEGSHPLYVCEAENSLEVPSAVLAKLFYADSALTRPLIGSESLVSFEKARNLIGFVPQNQARTWFSAE